MIALLLLLQGAGTATVGDTLWIERPVGTAGGAIIRPQIWSLTPVGQQLAPGEVVHRESGAVIRYPVVIWYPGEHRLTMPGPVIVRRDGSSDTLPAMPVRVMVQSVLPLGARRSALPPKAASDAVPLAARSPVPLLGLLAVLLVFLSIAAILWRRRGKAPVRKAPRAVRSGERLDRTFHEPAVLAAWAAAGEYRAALEGWAWRLARRMADSRDLEETARLQTLLDAIEDSAYSPRGQEYFSALCRKAAEVAG